MDGGVSLGSIGINGYARARTHTYTHRRPEQDLLKPTQDLAVLWRHRLVEREWEAHAVPTPPVTHRQHFIIPKIL